MLINGALSVYTHTHNTTQTYPKMIHSKVLKASAQSQVKELLTQMALYGTKLDTVLLGSTTAHSVEVVEE